VIGNNLKTIESIIGSIITQLKERPLAVIKFNLLKAARGWYGTDSQKYETAVLLIQIP
jgi:hypothetical protein